MAIVSMGQYWGDWRSRHSPRVHEEWQLGTMYRWAINTVCGWNLAKMNDPKITFQPKFYITNNDGIYVRFQKNHLNDEDTFQSKGIFEKETKDKKVWMYTVTVFDEAVCKNNTWVLYSCGDESYDQVVEWRRELVGQLG